MSWSTTAYDNGASSQSSWNDSWSSQAGGSGTSTTIDGVTQQWSGIPPFWALVSDYLGEPGPGPGQESYGAGPFWGDSEGLVTAGGIDYPWNGTHETGQADENQPVPVVPSPESPVFGPRTLPGSIAGNPDAGWTSWP